MANYDSPWKQATNLFLKELMEFSFPEFAQEIDWSHPYESMEQELDALTPENYHKDGVIDKLFKVRLKNGKEHFAHIHFEVQLEKPDFPERMGRYIIRLTDKCGPNLFSAAILIDNNPNWRPNTYHQSFWGCELTIKFQTLKVLDYVNQINELEESNNPFALVMLIHVLAWKKGTIDQKLELKKEIGRLLIRKKFGITYTKALLNFLDFLIQLPKPEEKQYYRNIIEYDQELKTMFIPAYIEDEVNEAMKVAEAKGKAEGKAEGKVEGHKQGEADMLLNLLSFKFGAIPNDIREKVNQASEPQLTAWARNLFAAQSLEELFK